MRKERVDPTPETVAKLKPCSLSFLEPDLQRAGYLIADAFAAITLGIGFKINDLITVGKGVMPPEFTDAVAEKIIAYKKWTSIMKDRGLPVAPVLDVCYENLSCTDIARKNRRHKTWAFSFIREALDLYNEVNG